jgi:hypothetical protein
MGPQVLRSPFEGCRKEKHAGDKGQDCSHHMAAGNSFGLPAQIRKKHADIKNRKPGDRDDMGVCPPKGDRAYEQKQKKQIFARR